MKKRNLLVLIFLQLFIALFLGIKIYSLIDVREYKKNIYKFTHSNLTDSNIKELIAIDYPEINNKEISDFEKVNILRQWVHKNFINTGSYENNINQLLLNKDISSMYNLINKTNGGVNCVGNSYGLMKLYKLYGFDSYTYGYGKIGNWHRVTLVKIKNNGNNIIVIQDASYDVTYVDKNGKPFDFISLLSVIKEGKINEIKIVKGKARPSIWVCRITDKCIYGHQYRVTSEIKERIIKFQIEENVIDLQKINLFIYGGDLMDSDSIIYKDYDFLYK